MLPFTQGQTIILLVLFAAGFIIGALLTWFLAARGKNVEKPPEQDAWTKLRDQYNERTSLWQERASGKLVVRVDGHMLDRADQLSDAQRKTMNGTLKEWLGWMGFPVAQPAATPPPAAGTAPLVTPPPAVAIHPSEPAAPEARPAGAEAGLPGQSPAQAVAAKPKSIVEQIDAILQEKIKTTPGMHKGVKLVEDPKEGVVVWVGLEHFAGVDAVTDPEVKALLRAAAAEWEQQHTLGKQ